MEREKLRELTEGFLKTYGYISKPTNNPNCTLFSRPTGMGTLDELLVYFHEKGEENLLDLKLRAIAERYERIPGGEGGRRFFLSTVPLGRVPESVIEYGFTYQVPVWFFDREFSAERKKTPLKLLEEEAAKYEKERIEQPYKTDEEEGDDLLSCLMEELKNPKQACLRIIVAPAGYGKTVLMSTLYTKLRERFLENKKRQIPGRRPLIMLPGHIGRANDLNGLINNFIGDEYDYGIANIESLKFWIKNDLAIWLMDGVEELLLKISPVDAIYELLDEYIAAGIKSTPQIVIAVRKSILAISSELRDVIEDNKEMIKLYELCEWGLEQQKKYFYKNLRVSREEKEDFIKDLNSSETLQNVCSIPYYCSLIADLKNNESQTAIFNDECELVEYSIKKMCEREFQKGIEEEFLSIDTQVELFIELTYESFKQEGKITKELLIDVAKVFLGDYNEEIQRKYTDYLLRHALLTQKGEDIDFTHEIIKKYLYGVVLMNELEATRVEFFEKNEIEKDSITFKYLLKNLNKVDRNDKKNDKEKVKEVDWEKVMQATYKLNSLPDSPAIGFRNIMNIFLSLEKISEKEKILQKYQLLMNKNLSGLVFKDLNLNNFNIQRSNLTDVEFYNCNLSNAKLDGCYFKRTFFDLECDMRGMTIKGAVLESIRKDAKVIDDRKEIRAYFYERTKVWEERNEPCQAVINLRKVLEKIVRKGRGMKVPKKFVSSIKCGGRIPTDKILKSCIDQGIMSEIGDYLRVKINIFDEVEQFVKNLSVTDNIYKVLDDICNDKDIGCRHIF